MAIRVFHGDPDLKPNCIGCGFINKPCENYGIPIRTVKVSDKEGGWVFFDCHSKNDGEAIRLAKKKYKNKKWAIKFENYKRPD